MYNVLFVYNIQRVFDGICKGSESFYGFYCCFIVLNILNVVFYSYGIQYFFYVDIGGIYVYKIYSWSEDICER